MLRHVMSHVNIRPFACRLCGQAYNRTDSLIRHIERVHLNIASPALHVDPILTTAEVFDFLCFPHFTEVEQPQLEPRIVSPTGAIINGVSLSDSTKPDVNKSNPVMSYNFSVPRPNA